MPTVNNKARYISVAVTTEGEVSRTIGGSPPNPAGAPQTLWIAGSSCEILGFPTTARDDDAPTINIQGDMTTMTGPVSPNESFTYAIAVDASKKSYVVGGFYEVDETTWINNVAVFATGANGNAAPLQYITAGAYTSTQLSADISAGVMTLPVVDITGFLEGDLISLYLADGGELFLTTVASPPSGGNIPIADMLPFGSSAGHDVNNLGNRLNYWQKCVTADLSFGGICVDPSTDIFVGLSGPSTIVSGGFLLVDTIVTAQILKFASGSTGNVVPTLIVDLGYGISITSLLYDAVRNWIWVSGSTGGSSGFVKAYNTSGVLQRTITGATTTLTSPTQVCFAPDGSIVVSNNLSSFHSGKAAVNVFAASASGDVAPLHTFGDGATAGYLGVSVDAANECWVSTDAQTIQMFPFPSDGVTVPTTTLINSALNTMPGNFDTGPVNLVVTS